MIVVLCVVLALGALSSEAKDIPAATRIHTIFLYEHINFQGERVTVSNRDLGRCFELAEKWRNRVSSVNTSGDCWEFYKTKDCSGDAKFVYPGSPSHFNLHKIDLGDNIGSFQLCNLDESDGSCRSRRSVGVRETKISREEERKRTGSLIPKSSIHRRSLNPGRPERPFWEYFFGRFDRGYLSEFLERARKCWFIRWDFIYGVPQTASGGRQYQYALDWVMNVVNAGTFSRDELVELRRRAGLVVDDRTQLNNQHRPTSSSRSQATHEQTETIWRDILNTLDTAINNNDDNDELR